MSLSETLLVVLSASLHVFWNFLAKSNNHPTIFFAIVGIPIVVFALLMMVFVDVTQIPLIVLLYAIASGLVHAFYFFALGLAYSSGNMSFVYPIVRSAPAFVPVVAFFVLDETLSKRGMVGIGIVIFCILLLQITNKQSSDHRQPSTRNGSVWAIVTLFTVVCYTMVDKLGMLAFNKSMVFTAYIRGPVFFLLQGGIASIVYWLTMGLRKLQFDEITRQQWINGTIAGIGIIFSYSLILIVMQTAKISYIVTMRQSSILIATLVGWLILKENNALPRFFISLILVVGLIFVATAE